MEPVQKIWDKNSGYFPEKMHTKFFLLDGDDKLVAFVDETPLIESEFEEGIFHYDEEKGSEVSVPMQSWCGNNSPREYDTLIKKAEGLGGFQKVKRNPYKSDGKWIEMVQDLVGPFANFEPVKKEDDEKEDDADDKGLMDMPLEVFEALIPFVDGVSFFNLCRVDPRLENLMWSALGSNPVQNWIYWRNACLFKLNRQQMLQILSSYDGIVDRQARIDPGQQHPFIPFDDALDNHNWEDVCLSVWNLPEILYDWNLDVKNMTNLESKIKSDLQMTVANTDGVIPDYKNIDRITQTSGSIIYNIMSPWRPRSTFVNARVMEDLDGCSVRRMFQVCKSGVNFVKLMYVPMFQSPSESKGPGLPRVQRILISVCSSCMVISPLQEGHSQRILFEAANYSHRHNMHPVVAIHENVVCVWASPRDLKTYRCHMSEGGVEIQLITRIHFREVLTYWESLADYREFYIPILEKRDGNSCTEDEEEVQKEDCYELKFVSLRYGLDSIVANNDNNLIKRGKYTPFVLVHQYPQYYINNGMKLRDTLDMVYSGAQGYGMFVFWNDAAVGISWDGVTWLLSAWKHALESIVGDDDHQINIIQNVSHVEIVSPDYILVAVDGNIVILSVKRIEGKLRDCGTKWLEVDPEFSSTEPKLKLEVIRLIYMDLSSVGLEFDRITFDYDKGNPYIFLTLKKNGSETGLDFFFKRICFQNEEDALLVGKKPRRVEPKAPPTKENEEDEWTPPVLDLDWDLFNLHSYPRVLKRIQQLRELKKSGSPMPKGREPAKPKPRKRYKGENKISYHHYLMSLDAKPEPEPAVPSTTNSFAEKFLASKSGYNCNV